jgi:DNA-directed RNA polymerase specialized sigma24 family protein
MLQKTHTLRDNFFLHKKDLQNSYAELLELYFEQNLSYKDLSIQLNVSIASTKQLVAKALLELRRVSNDSDYLKAMEILHKA